MRRLLVAIPALLALLAWVACSQVAGEAVVPGPAAVAGALVPMLAEGQLWAALGGTFGRMLSSFLLATVLGVVLGVLPGSTGPFRRGMDLLVDFLRSIPGPALLPLFMTFFGLYSGPKVALAVFVCTLINVVYTSTGIRLAERSVRTTMARVLGASEWFVFWKVVLPGALELILGGLRVTLSLALVLSVLAELVLMTGHGIGVMIRIFYEDRRLPEMYAAILIAGCLGALLNAGFVAAERRFAWYRRGDAAADVQPVVPAY